MIITFNWINDAGIREASMAVSACSALTALQFSLKTLVLQFHNGLPVEKVLIKGEEDNEAEKMHGGIANRGIDALIRYQSFSALTEEHFNTCVSHAFKSNNLLDIMEAPILEGFAMGMQDKKEELEEIIRVAEEIYDNVFILLDGAGSRLTNTIDSVLSDHIHRKVLVFGQGDVPVKEIVTDNIDTYYLLCNYDDRSVFSERYYKKALGSKNVYSMPYNVSFKDAGLKGDVLLFLRKNMLTDSLDERTTKKEDINEEFIFKTMKLTEKLSEMNVTVKAEPAKEEYWEHKQVERKRDEKRMLTGENVVIKEFGRLGRQRKTTIDFESNDTVACIGTSNFMYKTKRHTFEKLKKVADKHKRSISAELDSIVKNYLYYLETTEAIEVRKRKKHGVQIVAKNAYIS